MKRAIKMDRLLRVLLFLDSHRKTAQTLGETYHMTSATMMRQAHLSSIAFYELIGRLEEAGWIEGEWEVVPEGLIRPPRRYYHLTPTGISAAQQITAENDVFRSVWRRFTRGIRK